MCDGMKNKDKKLIANIVILGGIALSIASFITPISSFDVSEVYRDHGFTELDSYWKLDAYLTVSHYMILSQGMQGNRYKIFTIFSIEDEFYTEMDYRGSWITSYDLDPTRDNTPVLSNAILEMAQFAAQVILLCLLIYFCFKSSKTCCQKKTKYPLYTGCITLVLALSDFFGVYLTLGNIDYDALGYTNYIGFKLGFYYLIIASALFLIGYIVQWYFIDFSEDKPIVEKALFEKYEKKM